MSESTIEKYYNGGFVAEKVIFTLGEKVHKMYLPKAKTKLSAGLDIRSTKGLMLEPGKTAKFKTGVFIETMPEDIYFDLEIRSSLRFKYGITTLGTGVIDGDFKDEIQVLLHNSSKVTYMAHAGDRIAQLIPRKNLIQSLCPSLIEENERIGGFGSTNE